MIVLNARNVNDALVRGLALIRERGVPRDSRNGPVMVLDQPVTTRYERPRERVLGWPWRDANPFFHLYEALWMLSGARDVNSVAIYVKRMRQFSDDGLTLHGAYGYRWRHHFFDENGHGVDQLWQVVGGLRANQGCRRQVVQMWDPGADLGGTGKDLPCNLTVNFQVVNGVLDMYVFSRSNDIIWGAYGANAVHFSLLQEYVAGLAGFPVGAYEQVSCNWHAYVSTLADMPENDLLEKDWDPYAQGEWEPGLPLIPEGMGQDQVEHEIAYFVANHGRGEYSMPFLQGAAKPLMEAHAHYRHHDGEEKYQGALRILEGCTSVDWREAARDWVTRRYNRWVRATEDGPEAAHEAAE